MVRQTTILGCCENFRVVHKKLQRGEGALLYTETNSLMYFEGTPEILGSTIVLHSEDTHELGIVKASLKKML